MKKQSLKNLNENLRELAREEVVRELTKKFTKEHDLESLEKLKQITNEKQIIFTGNTKGM